MIRPDGLAPATREMMKERMGADKFKAASVLSRALSQKQWPENRIRPNNRMSQKTLGALQAQADTPEVKRFLGKLESNQFSVSSREWHYFKYKYQYGENLTSPADLDKRFDAVLSDSKARIFRSGERYVAYSDSARRWGIIHPNGQRVTVYSPTDDELTKLGITYGLSVL